MTRITISRRGFIVLSAAGAGAATTGLAPLGAMAGATQPSDAWVGLFRAANLASEISGAGYQRQPFAERMTFRCLGGHWGTVTHAGIWWEAFFSGPIWMPLPRLPFITDCDELTIAGITIE